MATEAECMETHILTYTEVLSAKEKKGLVENNTKKNKKEEDGAFDLPIASGTWFDLLWVKHKWGERVETARLVKLYICSAIFRVYNTKCNMRWRAGLSVI